MTPGEELRALTQVLEMPEKIVSNLARKIAAPGREVACSREGEWIPDQAGAGSGDSGAGSWLLLRREIAHRETQRGDGLRGDREDGPKRVWAAGDRNGFIHLMGSWDAGALRGALLRLPGNEWLELRPGNGRHPLFGQCDELFHHTRLPPTSRPPATSGRSVGLLPVQDYSRLETLPPLDRPGSLPPGAGSAVLNFLALLMGVGGSKKARYRGPYPTPALFSTLERSFVPLVEGVNALEVFTRRETELAFRAEMALNPLGWEPAPFSPVLPHSRILVQVRNGVEGVWVDRTHFRSAAGKDPSTAGGARVWREESGGGEAYGVGLVLMGRPWRRFCLLDRQGNVLDRSLPALTGGKDGPSLTPLHRSWNPVVTGWAVLQAHPALANSVSAIGDRFGLWWASQPLSLARETVGGVEINAGLPEQFHRRREEGEEPGELAMMLISDVLQATSPLLKRAAQKELERLARPNPEHLFREGERVQSEARRILNEQLPRLVSAIQRGESLPDG